MAVKSAKRFGSGQRFANLREILAENDDNDVMVAFRIVEFHKDVKNDFGNYNCPVSAHVRVLDGPSAGEVFPASEEYPFRGAITSALRGVANPKPGEHSEAPDNEVGDDIVVMLHLSRKGKGNETVFGNEPSSHEMKAALDTEWFDDKAEEFVWPDWDEQQSASPAGERETVGAGAGGGRKKPW